MATTRYPRLKLAISALSAASVIAGAAYFRSAQDGPSDATQASDAAQSTVITTAYQPGTTPNTSGQSTTAAAATTTAQPVAASSATKAKTSRAS